MKAPSKPEKRIKKAKKEGRVERYKRQARQIHDNPKSIGTMIRGALLGVWRARGGGLYGLGYVVTFIVLEIRLIVGDVAESEGVVDFVSSQLIEFIFRFGIQSFVNGFLAFLWPVYVLNWLGTWSIVLLVGGYYGFEKLLRPAVEEWLPELRSDPAGEEDEVAEDR
ncbi:MAG: hypothetical protein O7G86_06425 [Gammaproteobacteria bacterium]|nr:hypothetical protein [Gammaproteobacteria bacterium]MCZ6853539.1 hypothetical protein [Gammaproteobacteria bacterium]